MDVVYNHFGSKPQALMTVRRYQKPPALDSALEGVIVKVEVSAMRLICSRIGCQYLQKLKVL